MDEDGLILEPEELIGMTMVGVLDMYDSDGTLMEESVAVRFIVDSMGMAEKLVELLPINAEWIKHD